MGGGKESHTLYYMFFGTVQYLKELEACIDGRRLLKELVDLADRILVHQVNFKVIAFKLMHNNYAIYYKFTLLSMDYIEIAPSRATCMKDITFKF